MTHIQSFCQWTYHLIKYHIVNYWRKNHIAYKYGIIKFIKNRQYTWNSNGIVFRILWWSSDVQWSKYIFKCYVYFEYQRVGNKIDFSKFLFFSKIRIFVVTMKYWVEMFCGEESIEMDGYLSLNATRKNIKTSWISNFYQIADGQ